MTKSRWALNTFLRLLQSSHYSISHRLAKITKYNACNKSCCEELIARPSEDLRIQYPLGFAKWPSEERNLPNALERDLGQ